MSLRKWNDSKGWSRGAKGIDDEKGADYTQKHNSAASNRAQFGRAWDFAGAGKANASETSVGVGGKDGESPDYDTK